MLLENKYYTKATQKSKMLGMRYNVFRAFIWQIWQVIHELLSIFMVMLNNVKIELTNAIENCLPNIKDLCLPLNCALPILFSSAQDQII